MNAYDPDVIKNDQHNTIMMLFRTYEHVLS